MTQDSQRDARITATVKVELALREFERTTGLQVSRVDIEHDTKEGIELLFAHIKAEL